MEPINLLIKPASGKCNLRCRYCFYQDEMKNRTIPDYQFMSLRTLEKLIRNALSFSAGCCSIAFQGGEPTLIGLNFYRKAVEFAARYNVNHCRIDFSIQTNGTLLNEEWAEFLAAHHFLVGISLDGNESCHDACRIDGAGKGTFHQVMKAIALLRKFHVEYNILTVISSANANHAREIYEFFREQGFGYQQYMECMEPLDPVCGEQNYSLKPSMLAHFLKDLFDLWYQDMKAGRYVYIRYFENLIMLLAGQCPESCTNRGICGKQWVVEADGSVYPCDFYVLDQWKLGNLAEDSMKKIEETREKLHFIGSSSCLPEECRKCRWFPLCRNGCRRNCLFDAGGRRQTNRYCAAYREFLEYSCSRFLEIMELYRVPVQIHIAE